MWWLILEIKCGKNLVFVYFYFDELMMEVIDYVDFIDFKGKGFLEVNL